jgi:hypothetical protein
MSQTKAQLIDGKGSATFDGDLTVDTNTLYVDSANNRVGIGTTSPSVALHVVGDSIRVVNDETINIIPGASENDAGRIQTSSGSALAFATNGSAGEQMRLDTSGRLLVGTSTAMDSVTSQLQIVGTSGGFIGMGRDDGSVVNGDNLGSIDWYGNDGGTYERSATILVEADGTHSAGSKPGRLMFSTTAAGDALPTEQLRIGADGTISTTAGSTPNASTFGTALGRASNPGLLESYRDGTTTASVCNFGGPLGNALVKCDGDLENTNNRYTGISDIKLKENIVDATSQWTDIKNLKVRNYNFKAETGFSTRTQIGLIAQEVELVSPGLIGETLNEDTGELTKNVAYSVLYMKAVKALQEAMERIEVLEQRLTDAGIA